MHKGSRAVGTPLPQEIPRVTFLEPATEGWPPQPKGATSFAVVPWQEIPGSLTDAREAEIRQAALADARVRAALGTRFAFISADTVEPDKARPRNSAEPLRVRLTFFSHENNVAVEVRTSGTTMESVERKQGYEPPEGREEIEQAVALARRDPRIARQVGNLRGEAILSSASGERTYASHRVLYVSFSREEDDHILYFAYVDLTNQTVLSAEPVSGSERR